MFETENLRICFWKEDLAQDFFELTQDEGFNLFPISIYRQPSFASASEWVKKMYEQNLSTNLGKYAVIEKSSQSIIGMGGLTPWVFEGEEMIDITYRLHSSIMGRGLGTELARGLVQFAFDTLKLKEITATITPDNIASKKIVEKLNFKYDRHIFLLNVPTDLYRLRV